VIAKIEREEAIELMDSIIEVSDGLLIARGDMAVELGAERVPVVQKQLIHACNLLGVPVITATQMLESMISCPSPTRAEASDVANAVFDGTDAVMLSGETASGEYPVETVQTMTKIIKGAEEASQYSKHPQVQPTHASVVDSIEYSAAKIAHHVGASSIVCMTHSGTAARTLAKYRPSTPIVALTENEDVLRKLSFTWGVHGCPITEFAPTDDLFSLIEKVMKENDLAHDDDLIVITAGVPSLRRGTTNMIKVHRMGSPMERNVKK
jgi:pyruvate kinase